MKESDYQDSRIKALESENTKYIGFLVVAGIIAVVFAILYFSVNNKSNQQSTMIDTCKSEISSLNDTISTVNDSLDSISSNASDAAGNDYETQAAALDDISSKADGAKGSGNSEDTACQQVVIESNSSN